MPNKIRSIYEFESRVGGIPCVIAITYYHPGYPASYSGPCMGPEESPEADWVILDRRGYPAKWLERKLTSAERERIDREAVEIMQS